MSERPVKVMHLLPHGQKAGMEKGVLTVVNGLTGSRLRFDICILSGPNCLAEHVRAQPVRFWCVPRHGEGVDWSLCLRLARLLRSERPDIVHTHNWGTFLFGVTAAWLAGFPRVIHGEHGYNLIDLKPQRRRRLIGGRLLCQGVHAFTAVTAEIARRMERQWGVATESIWVIPNGIDTAAFHPCGQEMRLEVRRELQLAEDHFVIGTVGRLDPVKNQGLLLAALAEASFGGQGESLRCVIVGDGPERAALRAQAEKLGLGSRVVFTGGRDDVNRLLAAFDAFVLPSLAEGCSNTLLEAMASGVPVVASRIEGNLELLGEELSSLCFEPHDRHELARRLRDVLAAPELLRSQAEKGLRLVKERYTLSRMLESYQELYLSLAEPRRRAACRAA